MQLDIMPELSPGADLPEQEPVQLASANIVRKVTDAASEPIKRVADVINRPAPKGQEPMANVSEPLVRVEETGDVLVRRATAEELANLKEFADEVPVDSEIILPNLSRIAMAADPKRPDRPMEGTTTLD
ncbi:MAG TPA: hypothetical protein DCW74_01565, partial [Alteromonas australica]|nr:hypothetical protein [Alteromonas australica]